MKFPRPLPRRLLQLPANAPQFLAFRTVRADDHDSLYHACYAHYAEPYFEASFRRILRDQAAGRSIQLVVEMEEEGIIGSGQLVRYSSARAEIADLAVVADWRDRGVGTALIQVLTRIAQASGIRQLEIGVTDDNQRALALYRRLGFSPTREVSLPEGGWAYFLAKELAPSESGVEPTPGQAGEQNETNRPR